MQRQSTRLIRMKGVLDLANKARRLRGTAKEYLSNPQEATCYLMVVL